MPFTVKAQIYVRAGDAVDAINRIADELRGEGWAIINADVNPTPAGFSNAYGTLAQMQPASWIIDRPGASQKDAQAEVIKAIQEDGDYSIVSKIAADVVGTADAAAKAAQGIGNGLSDHPPDPNKAMSTVEIVALAVIGITLLIGGVFVVRQVRSVTG